MRADSKTTTDVAPRSAQATEERAVCCTCAILFISPFWSSEATKTKPKHFLSIFCGSPLHLPAVLKGKGRKFLVLVRDWKEREVRVVSITTKSERTIWFKATTRSARASCFKILRILLVQCSNFVQETPQRKLKTVYQDCF